MQAISKFLNFRRESPESSNQDRLTIEDTSLNPIVFRTVEEGDIQKDAIEESTLLSETSDRAPKDLHRHAATVITIDRTIRNGNTEKVVLNIQNVQLPITILIEEGKLHFYPLKDVAFFKSTYKRYFIVDTDNMTSTNNIFYNKEARYEAERDNSVEELEDISNPIASRGFYGLDEIMIRRQQVTIKTFVDKMVQVGNGHISSRDFACQTSSDASPVITISDYDKEMSLDEYLRNSADESYHSEKSTDDESDNYDLCNEICTESSSNSNRKENSIIIPTEKKGKDKDLASENVFFGSDANEGMNQDHIVGLITPGKDEISFAKTAVTSTTDRIAENFWKRIVNEEKENKGGEKRITLGHSQEINQILNQSVPENIGDESLPSVGLLCSSKENRHVSCISEDPKKLCTITHESEKLDKNSALSSNALVVEKINTSSCAIDNLQESTRLKEKKKVTISPDMTDSEDLYFHSTHIVNEMKNLTIDAESENVPSDEYSFRMTHDTLVELLTDVEPDKNHWKLMRKVDLSSRNLESLNHLDHLMPKLKELDANFNLLRYLTGLPSTITTLQIRSNRLTSLTGFAHLPNLEYLDISQNRIESLIDLYRLEHLREVCADDNLITSCSAFLRISGLVKLSLRGNKIKSVDFGSCEMHRLEFLDLSANRLEAIENVESLDALKALYLNCNALTSFGVKKPMPQLNSLHITYNKLSVLDVGSFPNLRLLWVDGNRLKTIKRPETLAFLETFSARDQNGNPIKTLESIIDFYKLEYLELSGTSIKELPRRLSQACPSVIVLILGYNEIQDFSPIRKMKQLRRLFLEGNQISDYVTFSEVLKSLPKLKYIDLRDNPFSLKFYPPIEPYSTNIHMNTYTMHQGGEEICWARLDKEYQQKLEDQWYVKRNFYRYDVFRRCPHIEWLDGAYVEPREKECVINTLQMETVTKALRGNSFV
ncbi:10209_t:CDS:2 [Acaulospora morrowiae]|uniref:10209_t:CDS:1 n=1 Tax=Acaulospora morrowiae TaxID=94023 RepID=A0A9N9F0L5_9GLOM|nr:10209_t:CDS:2 [Acaulospora morrowiae]